ncbi:MAG: hypothetical protein WEA34_05355 [Gemmatimonadota bacterium]
MIDPVSLACDPSIEESFVAHAILGTMSDGEAEDLRASIRRLRERCS